MITLAQMGFNFLTLAFIYTEASWVFSLKNKVIEMENLILKKRAIISNVTEALTVLSNFFLTLCSILWPLFGVFTFLSNAFCIWIIINFLFDMILREQIKKGLISRAYKIIKWTNSFIGLLFAIFVIVDYNLHIKTGIDLIEKLSHIKLP